MKQIKNRDLYRAFAPVRRRVLLKHMLQYASWGIIAVLGLSLLLCGISFLIPIENLWQICGIAGLILFAFSLLTGWIVRPSCSRIAKAVDRLGLQEKVQTALELEDREDAIALLQRQDAIRSLNGLNRKLISLNLPRRHYYIAAVFVVSLVLINFIPNPMDTVIRQKQQLKAEIEKQLEELKDTTDKVLADNKIMTEEQKEGLARLVEELAEKLKGTGDYKEALKEISKTEERLAALSEEIQEQTLGQLAKKLEASDLTKALAAALNNMDSRDVESAVEQLKQQLTDSRNGEELSRELKDALSKAAEAISSGELKESLASISEGLENGSPAAALDELGEVLSNAIGSDNATGDIKYALQQMRNKVAKTAGQSGTQYAGNPGTSAGGEASNGNNTGNPGSNPSSNQSQGQSGQNGQNGQDGQGGQGNQGSGNGQGNQMGQGSSGNSGQSGSGIGDGTTNHSSGQGGTGTTGSQGSQTGDPGAQSTYEKIYAPERLGDGGEITHVQGQQTGSGEVNTEDGGRGAGDLSGYIPYKDIYLEYRSEAMTSMERRELPPGIRDLVRDYFSALGNETGGQNGDTGVFQDSEQD